jgi:F1F0 ATPase subunit 2
MHETLTLALAFGAGILLGAVFFGGLWWTVRTVMSSDRPAAWALGSLVLRTAIALVGFYLVSRGDRWRLLACLAGFVVGRVVVIWVSGQHAT